MTQLRYDSKISKYTGVKATKTLLQDHGPGQ